MKMLRKISIRNKWPLYVLVAITLVANVGFTLSKNEKHRLVSVNGTVSEIICALGLESNIIGVDVTSTFPAALDKLPKIGHSRNVSAEGVVALNPTLVIGTNNDLKPQTIEQLSSANVKTRLFNQDFSVDGTKKLIREIAASFNQSAKGEELIKNIDSDLAKVKKPSIKKKVLFIYARGAGTMMVAGKGTTIEKMIELAGGQNATNDFNDFKPLTAEALVGANPDVILLFETGLQSIGGVDGLLKIQGVADSNAGKNKKVIQMDGQLLTGFGPRVGKAIAELAAKLQ